MGAPRRPFPTYGDAMLPGRAREIARVNGLLAAARAGSGGTLVVRGEPGIGKTRLLEHAAEQAAGMTVLEARGVESDAELAFAGLFDLFRPLGEEDLTRITQDLAADQRHDLLDRLRGRPAGRGGAVRDLHRGAAHPLLGRGAAARAGLRGRRAVARPGVRGRHPVRRPAGPARPGGRAARRARRRRAPRAARLRGARAARAGRRGLGASCSGRRPAVPLGRLRPSAGWPRRPGATRWP